MANNNKRKPSLGWFFWVAFILLVALLFFINKNNIKTVLKKTNAMAIFEKNEEKKAPQKRVDIGIIQDEIEKINSQNEKITNSDKKEITKKDTKKKSKTEEVGQKDSSEGKKEIESTEAQKKKNEKKEKSAKAKNSSENKDIETTTKKKDKTETKQTTVANTSKKKNSASTKNTRSTTLYFIKVESDGHILKKPVVRNLPKTDSPLMEALNALLAGTTITEAKKGFRSFIPPKTKLLSVEVKDHIAVINLSEEFQFNQYGIEAYQAQLAQIVFTAFEFSTVSSVQFLIEGQRKQYLGGEGVWIGAPLTKDSF